MVYISFFYNSKKIVLEVSDGVSMNMNRSNSQRILIMCAVTELLSAFWG